MGSRRHRRRAGVAAVLAMFLLGAVVALTACGAGGENSPTLPSARASERTIEPRDSGEPEETRSREPDRTTEPAETSRPPRTTAAVPPEPTRTTRTTTPAESTTRATAPAEPTTRPPTSAAVVVPQPIETTRTTAPAETKPTPAASASAAAAAESQGLGSFGWLLVIVLVAALIVGGLLVYRSQRRSAWDTEARALESETRTVTATRLPPVLSTTTTAQRGLAWPPVRADIADMQSRWNALTERASGDARRNWSLRISGLLQDLITAVDAENEAMVIGRDWMMLRPRVNQAEQALAAVLSDQPQPEPPPAGEPGPPAFQT